MKLMFTRRSILVVMLTSLLPFNLAAITDTSQEIIFQLDNEDFTRVTDGVTTNAGANTRDKSLSSTNHATYLSFSFGQTITIRGMMILTKNIASTTQEDGMELKFMNGELGPVSCNSDETYEGMNSLFASGVGSVFNCDWVEADKGII